MKKKVLLSAILSIVLCMSLITGATMALFTSESKVNIAVTSGKVEVVAEVDGLEYKTLTQGWTAAAVTDTVTFDNLGGTATVVDGTVTLSKIVPGDGLKFQVKVNNNSDVSVKYRTVIKNADTTDAALFDALNVTIDGAKYTGALASVWQVLAAGVNGATLTVEIELPETASGNEIMNKTCAFVILVEAVQGNATTVDEVFAQEDATVDTATSTTVADTTVGNVGGTNAVVPAGTKLNDGADTVTLNITEADTANTGAFTFGEENVALNIDIPEVAAGNTGVIIVTLKGYFPNKPASVAMFHEGVMMTPVATLAEVDEADEYFYNSTTGDVVFATDNFSNFTAVENVKVVTTEQELYDVAFSQNRKYNNVHNVVVANNITLTKKIQVADGRGDLIIDLNGNTITAEMADDMFLAYSALTVKNGTLVATKAISNGKADVTLENVTVNVGKLGTSLFNGGYSLTLTNVEVNVENFKVNGGAFISNNAATKAVFTNTTFNIGLDTTYKAYFINRSADNVTMTGCTFNIVGTNGFVYDVARVEDANVADKYAFVQNNKWSGYVSTAWYNDEATSFTITSAMELAGLAKLVDAGTSFKGKTVTLAADIDLANVAWTPIGVNEAFEGTFDGGNYTISNLYVNLPELEGAGLFGYANNATIKNVTVKNANVTSYTMAAAIIGCPYQGCTISNCHVSGNINITANYAYAGGIAAYGYVDIDNCSVIADGTGYITAEERNAVGGITAWLLENGSTVTNCQVENLELTGWANIGSLTGFVHYGSEVTGNTAKNINITKTRVGGNGTLGYVAGGWCYSAGKTIVISNNTLENIVLNGNYTATASNLKGMGVMFGGEYYSNAEANTAEIFVMENNTLTNVVDGRYAKVETVAELAEVSAVAIDGVVIGFLNNISGNATITQRAGVSLVIDGKGYEYNGSIIINGDARANGEEALTIKNVNFVSETGVDFISAPSKIDGRYNYSHNITVDNCTFTATSYNVSVVGIKVNSCFGLTVTNCTATDIHSLLQAESCSETVTVDNCVVVGCKSGVSFNNTKNAVIKNSTIESIGEDGYGVRVKAECEGYALTVENCDITANLVAVLVRNAKATDYTATFKGTNDFTVGNEFGYEVVVCSGDWDDDSVAPVAPTGNVTVNGADGLVVYNG